MSLNEAGERIKARRLKLKLSQAELCEACQLEGLDLHQADISRIESGARWLKDFELKIMARILYSTPNKLLDFKSLPR